MPEQNFVVGHAQLPAQQRTALGITRGKPGRVDAVGQHGKRALPKQHFPGFLAASKAVSQARAEAAAHQPVQLPDKVRLIGGVVAVAHPHGDARPACHGIVKHAKPAVVAVDNAPLRVGGEQRAQFAQVAGQVIVLPHGQLVDAAAQCADLIIKKARLIVMIQKVELHLIAVDGAVDVHHKGLHAASVHGGHDL